MKSVGLLCRWTKPFSSASAHLLQCGLATEVYACESEQADLLSPSDIFKLPCQGGARASLLVFKDVVQDLGEASLQIVNSMRPLVYTQAKA